MQQENGTPQRSTLGLVQLKYSFFPQSKYPSWLKPQHLNYNIKFYEYFTACTKLNNLYKCKTCVFIIINYFIRDLYFLLAKIDEILQIWIFSIRLNYFVREWLFQKRLQCVREYKTNDRHTHLQEEEHQKT